jgi:hypothetical protein
MIPKNVTVGVAAVKIVAAQEAYQTRRTVTIQTLGAAIFIGPDARRDRRGRR